jgi:tetratricopeptide (TPR) repeat protein
VGETAAAESAFRTAVELDPSLLDAYSALGGMFASQKRLDEARAEFEKLAQARPQAAAGSYTLIGILYQAQNRNADARAAYEKAIASDSRAAVAGNNLAWLYAEEGGNLDVALELARTAKAQLPGRPEVNDTLGWIYYKKGLASLAVPPLEDAVNAAPKNAEYRFHLGLAYAKAGNATKAGEELRQALALNPTFAGAEEARKVLASLPK